MKARDLRMGVVGGALAAVALFGGRAAAGDYPPDNTTVTTVYTVRAPSGPRPASGAELADTGSDATTMLKLAGGAVLTGAGLLVAATVRRRAAAV